MNLFTRFVREEQGQDLIEYALLATFVSIVALGAATVLGTNLAAWYNAVAARVATATTTASGSGS